MNLQDIKQQIANACMQKEAKGFKSRLVYSPVISIFPDCWNMVTELFNSRNVKNATNQNWNGRILILRVNV